MTDKHRPPKLDLKDWSNLGALRAQSPPSTQDIQPAQTASEMSPALATDPTKRSASVVNTNDAKIAYKLAGESNVTTKPSVARPKPLSLHHRQSSQPLPSHKQPHLNYPAPPTSAKIVIAPSLASPSIRTPKDIANDIAIQCVSPLFPPYVDMSDALLVSRTIEAQQRKIIAQRAQDPISPVSSNGNNSSTSQNLRSVSGSSASSDPSIVTSTHNGNAVPVVVSLEKEGAHSQQLLKPTNGLYKHRTQSDRPQDLPSRPIEEAQSLSAEVSPAQPQTNNYPKPNKMQLHGIPPKSNSAPLPVNASSQSNSEASNLSLGSNSIQSNLTSPDDLSNATVLHTPRSMKRPRKPSQITVPVPSMSTVPVVNSAPVTMPSSYGPPLIATAAAGQYNPHHHSHSIRPGVGLYPRPSFQALVSKMASFIPKKRPASRDGVESEDDDEDDDEEEGNDPEDKALSESERDDVEQSAISLEDELAHTRKKKKTFHKRRISDVHKKERFLMLCAEMWDIMHD